MMKRTTMMVESENCLFSNLRLQTLLCNNTFRNELNGRKFRIAPYCTYKNLTSLIYLLKRDRSPWRPVYWSSPVMEDWWAFDGRKFSLKRKLRELLFALFAFLLGWYNWDRLITGRDGFGVVLTRLFLGNNIYKRPITEILQGNPEEIFDTYPGKRRVS